MGEEKLEEGPLQDGEPWCVSVYKDIVMTSVSYITNVLQLDSLQDRIHFPPA